MVGLLSYFCVLPFSDLTNKIMVICPRSSLHPRKNIKKCWNVISPLFGHFLLLPSDQWHTHKNVLNFIGFYIEENSRNKNVRLKSHIIENRRISFQDKNIFEAKVSTQVRYLDFLIIFYVLYM